MTEHNGKQKSHEPLTEVQQQNQEAVLFDDQTVLSRIQDQEGAGKVEEGLWSQNIVGLFAETTGRY